MDINQHLLSIVNKYNLNFTAETSCLIKFCEEDLLQSLKVIPPNKVVALWGTGLHTDELIKYYRSILDAHNVTCIIEHNPEQFNGNYLGYPVISPEEAFQTVEYVIISSFSNSYVISKQIKENSSIPYINLHKDNLNPFFMIEHRGTMGKTMKCFLKYGIINRLQQEYRACNDSDKRAAMLREEIEIFIQVRDFMQVFRCCETYIENKYPDFISIQNFTIELQDFLNDIKTKIKNAKSNQKNQVILFTFDTLNKESIEDCSFIKELQSNNISFENAYSTSSCTPPFCKGLLMGEYLFGPTVYLDFEFDNFTLVNECKKMDTLFFLTPVHEFSMSKIDEHRDKQYVKIPWDYLDWRNTMGETLWSFLCFYLENMDKDFIAYLHLMEMHTPFFGGQHEDKLVLPLEGIELERDLRTSDEEVKKTKVHTRQIKKQMKEVRKYCDNLFKYYYDFMPTQCRKLLTGDHGYSLTSEELLIVTVYLKESTTHVPLIVIDDTPQVCTGMYSHIDMMNLLLDLWNGRDITHYANREYVVMERPTLLSQRFKALYEGDNPNYFNNVVTIRRKDDMFLYIIQDQTEYYYRMPDESTNLIEDNLYQEEIEYLRSKMFEHLSQYDLQSLIN